MLTGSMRTEAVANKPERAPAPVSPGLEDIRVSGVSRLITPLQVKEAFPMRPESQETVLRGRTVARQIINGEDDRMLVVVGPCSIHDPAAAYEYAERLAELRDEVSERYFLVMRVYFEKPRTTVGWKGLINDPHLDESCDIAHGISTARRLLLDITALGVPTATEFLDPIIPQYTADLVCWAAVGARTTESQTHREMASGLSMPVGFKNGTDGTIQTAVDAMRASRSPHSFLGIDQNGSTSVIKTSGNPDCHLVLRGGRSGPNYSADHIRAATDALQEFGLPPVAMIDCSHANSGKDPQRQPEVWNSVSQQHREGNRRILGVMVESNLHAGNQKVAGDRKDLQYGVSITDGCIDWETTARMFREA